MENAIEQDDAAWVKAAAQSGNAQAQVLLGRWLLKGHGLPADPEQAFHWFMRAAHLGDAMGMNLVGRSHEQGWGTPRDDAKAVHWYRLAERLELPQARYNWANMLAAGRGTAADPAAAFALYEKAADQGFVKAYAKLGRYYEDGLVVEQDAAKAFWLYRRGAEGGDFRGQFCYAGVLAALGREQEALAWLEKVPETATAKYLRETGAMLVQSGAAAYRAVGERFLALASPEFPPPLGEG